MAFLSRDTNAALERNNGEDVSLLFSDEAEDSPNPPIAERSFNGDTPRREKMYLKPTQPPTGSSSRLTYGPSTKINVQKPPGQVVIREPFITHLGEYPVTRICPNCQRHVTTRVERRFKDDTYVLVLFMMCLCLPFMWVPFCMHSNSWFTHYCPECGACHGMHTA